MKLFYINRNMRLKSVNMKRVLGNSVSCRNTNFLSANYIVNGEARRSLKTVAEMPGPYSALPFVGSSWVYSMFGPYNIDTMATTAREDFFSKYGPIYKEKISGNFVVSVHDPKHIEDVLRNVGPTPTRMVNEVNVYWRRKKPELYKSVGLIDSTGESWLELRRKVARAIMKPSVTNNFIECLSLLSDEFVDIVKCHRHTNTKEISDTRSYFHSYALEAIWKCVFGIELGGMNPNPTPEIKKLITSTMDIFDALASLSLSMPLWKLFPTPTYKKFCRSEEYMARIVNRHTREILQNIQSGKDLTMDDTLFKRFLADKNFDIRDINTVNVDFVAAGIATTAYFLSLFLHRLGKEPEVQKRLQEQVDIALPDKQSTVTENTLKNIPLVNAAILEGGRLSTIIPGLLRILPADIVIGDYKIPKLTPIICQTRTAATSEMYFSSPHTFIPERWLINTSSLDESTLNLNKQARSTKFLVLPFGFGPRVCVGRRLAEKEIAILVVKIIKNFTIESEGEIQLENKSVLAPKSPVPLKFIDR